MGMETLGEKKIKSKWNIMAMAFYFGCLMVHFLPNPKCIFSFFFCVCVLVGMGGSSQIMGFSFVPLLSEASFINSNKPQEAKGKVDDRTKGWVQAAWVMG